MNWYEAWDIAYYKWEAVVQGAGWHELLLVAAYSCAALLCFGARQMSRSSGESGGVWFLAAIMLALLGGNTLYRIDNLLTNFVRAFAQTDGWYAGRREWQILILMFLCVVTLMTLKRYRVRLHEVWSECMPAVLGVGLLLLLALLQLISYHDTDTLFNLRLAGISTGRLLELAGLGMTVWGAIRWLYGRLDTYRQNGSPQKRRNTDDTSIRRQL